MSKKNNIPLKEMLHAIDHNDFNFYSRLNKNEKKAFSAWLAMRYASSANGISAYEHLLMVNDIVNVDFNTLTDHPELQWKLLAVCGTGKNHYHPWIHPGKTRKTKNKIESFLQEAFPTANRHELNLLQEINTKNELEELARDYGLDDKHIKELFK